MLFDIINIGGRPRKGRCVMMKQKTHYEWRIEYYRDGDGSACDLDFADKLSELRISCSDGYGHPLDDDGILEGWNIALSKRLYKSWHDDSSSFEDWDLWYEDFYYLKLVDGKFQFDPRHGEPPKRFKAQVEKLNKELT